MAFDSSMMTGASPAFFSQLLTPVYATPKRFTCFLEKKLFNLFSLFVFLYNQFRYEESGLTLAKLNRCNLKGVHAILELGCWYSWFLSLISLLLVLSTKISFFVNRNSSSDTLLIALHEIKKIVVNTTNTIFVSRCFNRDSLLRQKYIICMVSKNQKKLINSLYQKKYRKQHGLFVAEGKKVINELIEADVQLHSLFALDVSYFEISSDKSYLITETELKGISFLSTPQFCLLYTSPSPRD